MESQLIGNDDGKTKSIYAKEFRQKIEDARPTHKDKLRQKIADATPDFSKTTPYDFRTDHEILTRGSVVYNTPTKGDLRPSKIQHGDAVGQDKKTKSARLKPIGKDVENTR
ncbi:MAG: hypothetical protein FJX34_00035 [Alphaproteobacteria bacterium]|nr:hypothetical protein [Alphaproteobacteria bacterium]